MVAAYDDTPDCGCGGEKENNYLYCMKILSETAIGFVELSPEDDLYAFIGKQLKKLTGESIVVVNSVDSEASVICTRTVHGLGRLKEQIVELMGRNPVGVTYDLDDEALSYLNDGGLKQYPGGLYGLFLETVPRQACHALEKLCDLNKIYTMGFIKGGVLFGNAIIILSKGRELRNPEIIELFVKQASIALQRKQAEDALHESENRFRILLENLPNVAVRGYRSDGVIHYWNKASETVYGYSAQEAVGKNIVDLIIPSEMKDDVREILKRGAETGEMPHASELLLLRKDKSTVCVFSSNIVLKQSSREPELFCVDVNLTQLKYAEKKLRIKMDELEKFNKLMVGRELRMIELKKRVKELEDELKSKNGT